MMNYELNFAKIYISCTKSKKSVHIIVHFCYETYCSQLKILTTSL